MTDVKTKECKIRVSRLAIVISHPNQYASPWFKYLSDAGIYQIKVFYLWDFGIQNTYDTGFHRNLRWDIPLTEGYEYEVVQNVSGAPGTDYFWGLNNPGLIHAIAQWRPHFILIYGYVHYSLLRVILSPRLIRIPMFFRGDSHNLFRAAGFRFRIGRLARWVLFKRFAGVLAVGKANAQYFRDAWVPEKKIHFVPHCVDNKRFQIDPEGRSRAAQKWRDCLGIPKQAFVILFAGKLEAKKRPVDLLDAFSRFQNKLVEDSKTALLFVGNGALESELRARTESRINKDVFFAEFQNQKAMPVVYSASDVFVLPSFGRDETWGLAVNEAMNVGRPVIVSDHVGCAIDLVDDRESGWIFRAGQIDDLAAALTEAYAAGACRRKEMGRAGLERINAYSYENATKLLSRALLGHAWKSNARMGGASI